MSETCADCRVSRPTDAMYFVVPPQETDSYAETFWLCSFCWGRIVGWTPAPIDGGGT